ncbi:MAG: UDP-N-acetylglucosamine diphosphorylase [Verrucomicrobia bacterium]|jgi:UDP-N-acetylglucosamine diphosphorylase / glucose-1-phosphate thymidylyltransferase / UDP-N-acetylgalactosamine diphosphorylase / glucosamine-1-phosphate N-acetyltransferase / galactosamine-1-phosphate N-acetyltransferase|nr:UDP-N-acetylglucosamine diphosphorylase [Verrucomicrobiota bacterium]MDA7645270.1 UDP-N-acetylglucosamine diphosphorylase [bacterium]
MFSVGNLFDLSGTDHKAVFDNAQYAWDALGQIKAYVDANLTPNQAHTVKGKVFIDENVSIGEGTVVEEGAMILGPAIIGKNCQIRHSAYVRPYSVIGDDCVIGNACEIKHALIFNRCQIPHFNYIGDSILGVQVHMGAGVKISNLKLTPGTVLIDEVDQSGIPFDTGVRKFGALIGDRAEIGCNAVLNPGTILGRESIVYPNVSWRGVLPEHMMAKNKAPLDIVMSRPRTS